MSGTVNKVILIGNVAKDPEIITIDNTGRQVAKILLATSDSWVDKNTNQRMEKTEWHNISVFTEGLINIVKNYVKKGMKIYVQGSIQKKKYTDSQNIERYSVEIIVQGYNGALTMLSSKSGENASQYENKSDNNYSNNDDKLYMNQTDDLDDDVPF